MSLPFLRANTGKLLFISIAVLIPCFWHPHIEAGDLASHVYNAWLATLIEQGHAPGMRIEPMWNNVLVDVALTRLGSIFGFDAAEKIVASLAVLTFFWGTFAFATAASGNAPLFLSPAFAMVAYGWTFQSGFDNYYLSLGLAFAAVALTWRASGWRLIAGFGLALLAIPAHLLGFIFFIAAFVYIRATGVLPGLWKAFAPLVAILALFGARLFLAHQYSVKYAPAALLVNGVDQVILGARYVTLGKATVGFGLGCLFIDSVLRFRERDYRNRLWLPVSLYLASWAGAALLPDAIDAAQYPVGLSFLNPRFTSICAVLALAVLACMKPRVWHGVAFGACACVYFGLLWNDTSAMADLEAQAEQLVSRLPPGQRVTVTLHPMRETRFYFVSHIVDRACIGKCFSYSNYEPSSQRFRIRADPGNPIATDSAITARQIQDGKYLVRPEDPPLVQIQLCAPGGDKLCMRELHAGETNGGRR